MKLRDGFGASYTLGTAQSRPNSFRGFLSHGNAFVARSQARNAPRAVQTKFLHKNYLAWQRLRRPVWGRGTAAPDGLVYFTRALPSVRALPP